MRLSVCRKVDFGSAEYGGGLVEFPVAPEENRSLPTCRAIGFDPVACGCESGKENFSPVRLFAPKNDIPNPAKPCFRRFQPIGKRVKAEQTLFVGLCCSSLPCELILLLAERDVCQTRFALRRGVSGIEPEVTQLQPCDKANSAAFLPCGKGVSKTVIRAGISLRNAAVCIRLFSSYTPIIAKRKEVFTEKKLRTRSDMHPKS